ncbi:MAG: multidrug efflux MFS transporter NorA [Ktedonobacteraceae bacterium]
MSQVEHAPEKIQHAKKWYSAFTKGLLWQNRTLLVVSLAVCAAYSGVGMVGPVRVLYAQSRGASLTIIGLMASAYLVSNFLFQYPVGWLADHWGRKQVMLIGLIGQALISAVYLAVADPVAFVVLRFIEGIGTAALLPAARALIIDTIPAEKQGEAYGIFGAFFNAGFLLGPGIGGFLATFGYSAAFIGAVVFRIVAVVIVLLLVRNTSPGAGQAHANNTISYRSLFTLPLVAAYLIAFGDYLYLGFDQTLMPLWMHDHLGASVTLIGITYMMWAVPNMLLSAFGGRVADRTHHRSWLILLFGLAQVPLYFIYGFANATLIVIIFFTIHGIVYSFIQPAIDAHVAASSASNVRAQVQGVYGAIGLVGAFVGASGFSQLYSVNFRYPLFAMGIMYGICVLVGGITIMLLERRTYVHL